jgi:hypothetical protein
MSGKRTGNKYKKGAGALMAEAQLDHPRRHVWRSRLLKVGQVDAAGRLAFFGRASACGNWRALVPRIEPKPIRTPSPGGAPIWRHSQRSYPDSVHFVLEMF